MNNVIEVEKCNKNNRDSIISALCNIASSDEDFNGNNGELYLWDKAREGGYSSNMEYVANTVEGDNITDIVNNFLSLWQDHDTYYNMCEWDYEDIGEDGEVAITVAYVCGN